MVSLTSLPYATHLYYWDHGLSSPENRGAPVVSLTSLPYVIYLYYWDHGLSTPVNCRSPCGEPKLSLPYVTYIIGIMVWVHL